MIYIFINIQIILLLFELYFSHSTLMSSFEVFTEQTKISEKLRKLTACQSRSLPHKRQAIVQLLRAGHL